MTIILAILSGVALGYVLERGDFCFHSTLRGFFRQPRSLELWRAYLLTLLIAVPLVQVMILLGWIEPWVAPFVWPANIFGGLLFGVGMVIAQTCVTGIFYKLGHGMLGVVVALIAWFAGDVLTYRGPLMLLRNGLNSQVIHIDGQAATIMNILNIPVAVGLLALLWLGSALYLWRSPPAARGSYWRWPQLGIATGFVTSAAWLLATWGGSNYTYGTSYVPTSLYNFAVSGTPTDAWIPVTLFSIVPGALVAAKTSETLWVRGESFGRYVALAIGGLLMGVGAAISGGCNLGHGLVGVPLLSLGSITTTVAMFVGVGIGDRLFRRVGGG